MPMVLQLHYRLIKQIRHFGKRLTAKPDPQHWWVGFGVNGVSEIVKMWKGHFKGNIKPCQ